MVPRIAKAGHSFKGAGLYYLHDKDAKTKDRVVWTYTHNLPTSNPDRAFKWMAYTAMNANYLKQQAGVPATGRKSKGGVVYSFSLAWHPEQNPDKQTMLDAALETLALLKLEEHEAVFVSHNDRPHPHVHIICNLVHPENGKKAVPSYDRLIMSAWAEQLEKDGGKIYCEERVLNNEKRRRDAKENRQFELVKHREKKLQMAKTVQELYEHSDSGKAFRSALEQEGYTLAKGDRRGFVLVDRDGEIYSLSRQLKGQRANEIKTRLQDIGQLPEAKEIAQQRKHFDRDQYETDRQKKIVDAAIEESEKKQARNKGKEQKAIPEYDDTHLKKLDALRAWEQETQRRRDELEQQQQAQYNPSGLLEQIHKLEKELQANKGILGKLSGSFKARQEELESLKQTLANVNQRITEQNAAFELKAQEAKPKMDDEQIRQQRAEYIRRKMKHRERPDNRDKGSDLER